MTLPSYVEISPVAIQVYKSDIDPSISTLLEPTPQEYVAAFLPGGGSLPWKRPIQHDPSQARDLVTSHKREKIPCFYSLTDGGSSPEDAPFPLNLDERLDFPSTPRIVQRKFHNSGWHPPSRLPAKTREPEENFFPSTQGDARGAASAKEAMRRPRLPLSLASEAPER